MFNWIERLDELPLDYQFPNELIDPICTIEDWAKIEPHKNVFKQCILTYIDHIPDAIHMDINRGLQVQLSYVLANAMGFRGEEARESKRILKEFIKT